VPVLLELRGHDPDRAAVLEAHVGQRRLGEVLALGGRVVVLAAGQADQDGLDVLGEELLLVDSRE
jgi:hypothetical protein